MTCCWSKLNQRTKWKTELIFFYSSSICAQTIDLIWFQWLKNEFLFSLDMSKFELLRVQISYEQRNIWDVCKIRDEKEKVSIQFKTRITEKGHQSINWISSLFNYFLSENLSFDLSKRVCSNWISSEEKLFVSAVLSACCSCKKKQQLIIELLSITFCRRISRSMHRLWQINVFNF